MPSQIRIVDIVVAVCQLLLGMLSWAEAPVPTPGLLPLFAVAFAAAILFRYSAPTASAATIYGLSLLQAILLHEPYPMNLVVLAALYSVAAHGPTWANRVGLAGGAIGAGIFASLLQPGVLTQWNVYFVPTLLAVIMAWALGLARHGRIQQRVADEARIAALEASRTTDAELAVAAERARIAREMHDIVAHSLTVIIAQADGGSYAAKTNPEQAARALETIAEIGRDALADIRRILGVLRSADTDAAIVTPQPTASNLEEVIERVRETGAQVAYTTIGSPRTLPPGMGMTLQRVCQEALTNALKHAGPGATMTVALRWGEDEVTLQVDDDGRGAAAITDGAGTGIVGMRERAALFGGTLHAAPRPTGGFRVRLTLPLPRAPHQHKENAA